MALRYEQGSVEIRVLDQSLRGGESGGCERSKRAQSGVDRGVAGGPVMTSPRKGNRERVDHASLVHLHSSWRSSKADGEPLASSATTDKQFKA